MDLRIDFLRKEIIAQTKIRGRPTEEGAILDHIEERVKNVGNQVKYYRVNKFGICVIIAPKYESKRSVLLESHVDIVQPNLMPPEFGQKPNEQQIVATGLDNRLSSSILVSLARHVHPDHTTVILLFCIGEENGFTGIVVDEVYVLDAIIGKMPSGKFHPIFKTYKGTEYDIVNDFFFGKTDLVPCIGKGFCPVQQPMNSKKDLFDRFTDLSSFLRHSRSVEESVFRDAKFGYFSIPVVDMHHKRSVCSVKDVFALYTYLQSFLNKNL